MSAPAPTVIPELGQLLRRLKLGKTLDTLPERLALARAQQLGHAAFLELVLADEIDRRERTGTARRAAAARLDASMTLEIWDHDTPVAYDRTLWGKLTNLAFVEHHHGAFILGPVGVGKTHLAHALGHIACRRRLRVHADRADRLFKRLKAGRLDATYDQEMRRLIAVSLFIIDDFPCWSASSTRPGWTGRDPVKPAPSCTPTLGNRPFE